MYGDIMEAAVESYDDSAWYNVGIPHSFGIPYFMENDFYVGYGCYRRKLIIDKAWLGKKISVEFQGVFQEAEVFVNGKLAGSHKGGYTAFQVDISTLVKGGDNLLFVRVNNMWNPRLAPRAGEHVFNGGIYRDVSLLVTEPVHVAWYGTFVTTPEADQDQALAVIRTEIVNECITPVHCTLVSIVEFEGTAVFEARQSQFIQPGEQLEFVQQGTVASPRLWHPDTPQLYSLKSKVYVSGVLYDEYENAFGIRWFKFDAKEGFILNGEHYDIHGANVHQDHAGWSDAVTRSGMGRDVRLIKECGMNFIRGSHYPHHTHFAAECDRQGVLFWSELCYWGTGGAKVEGYWTSSAYPVHDEDKKEFEASCMLALREMIRTNRNHPSIVVWSVSNEPFFSDGKVMDEARALAVRLVEESRRLDPTRPAAVGGAQRQGFDVLGDLAGYNGDGAVLFPDPGFPSFVSEYGSVVSDRPGEYGPYYQDGVETNPCWRSGKAVWCGFHHGSILFDMGHMGIIDYYRLPLQAWYWYRKELRGIERLSPACDGVGYRLTLSADKAVIRTDGTDDVHLIVQIVDKDGNRVKHTAAVTLEVTEGGGVFPTGRTIRLSEETGSFLDGMGAIELRSYYAGSITVEAQSGELAAAKLRLEAVGGEAWEEQTVRWQEGPPARMKAPRTGESFNIARNRPVFCSSYADGFSPMHVTDGEPDTSWRSGSDQSSEWIMVDLEGSKNADKAIITLAEPLEDQTALTITCSFNRKRFMAVSGIRASEDNCALLVELPAAGLRYLKVSFPEKPVPVREIEIFT